MLHTLGLFLGFFAVPGVVIAGGMLVIRELKPGWLTKHKHRVFAVICIILAVYGTSIICTESEGGDYPGALNKYDRECSHEVIMAQQTSGQDMDIDILDSYRESQCRYCRMVAVLWYSLETQEARYAEQRLTEEANRKPVKGGWFSGGDAGSSFMTNYHLGRIANSLQGY